LSSTNQTFNIENNTAEKIYGHIENLYETNKELLERQLSALETQNQQLVKMIELLSKKA
jgi:hypothetical protein